MPKTPNIQYVAVKALIKNEKGQVLVLRQSDPTITGHGQCHPPGGIVELGETLEECVIREVEEEIGVASKVIRLFDVGEWRAERGDTIMQFVGLFYVCTIETEDFTIQASEASEAIWVGPDDIDTVDIVEPSKSILKKYLSKS